MENMDLKHRVWGENLPLRYLDTLCQRGKGMDEGVMMDRLAPTGDIESVALEQFHVYVQKSIPWETLAHSLEISTWRDIVLQSMVVSIQGYILAEEVDKRTRVVTFDYTIPASWWQQFKAEKFPGWLIKRFPVKTKAQQASKKVIFRRLATYPKANIVVPDLDKTIIYRNTWAEY